MRKYSVLSAAVVGVVAIGLSTQKAQATSYASEVALNGTNLTFQLNENAADVKLQATYGDGTHGVIDLGQQNVTFGTNGATPSGSSVSYSGFTAAPTSLNIVVSTADAGGYLAGSGSAAPFLQIGRDFGFGTPRDVAVDKNPTDNTFGRFYVVQAGAAASQGIYIYDPNQGEREGTEPNPPQNAGIPFVAGNGNSPYKIAVGPDGNLYVTDWADADTTIYRTKDDINATALATAQNIFVSVGNPAPAGGNHQDIISKPVFQGSAANGNLKVFALDSSYITSNQLKEWDFGSTQVSFAGQPTGLASPVIPVDGVICTVSQNTQLNNQFILTQNRSAGNEPGVFVVSTADNTTVGWDSLAQSMRGLDPSKLTGSKQVIVNPDGSVTTTNPDFFRGGVWASQITNDGRFLEMINTNSSTWSVPLLANIPDMLLAARVATGTAANGRGVDVDAANNVYIASSGNGVVRIAAPGGNSTAITTVGNGTTANNTFTINGLYAGNGNLSDSTKYFAGFVPNGNDQEVIFKDTAAPLLSGPHTVNVDSGFTYGAISFNSSAGYTLSGSNTITLNGFGANIFAEAGNNTISAPVAVNTDLGLYAAAGASLTISGPITISPSPSGLTYIVKNGTGTVTTPALKANFLDVYGGALKIARNSGATLITDFIAVDSTLTGAATSLNMASGGQLDLVNNGLIYDYSPSGNTVSPIIGLTKLVLAGSNGGAWNGTGIINSDGQTHSGFGVAVVNPSELGLSSFQGVTIPDPTHAVLVVGTFYGDSLLNGTVDLGNDFDLFLQGYLGGGTDWVFGDYNLDGKVDTTDFGLFIDGYKAAHGGSLGDLENVVEDSPLLSSSQKSALLAAVPEPSSIALLGLAACGLVRRRRATK